MSEPNPPGVPQAPRPVLPQQPQSPRPVVPHPASPPPIHPVTPQAPHATAPMAPHPAPPQPPHVTPPTPPHPAPPQAPRPVAPAPPQAPRTTAPGTPVAPTGPAKIAPLPVTHNKPVDLEPISLIDEPTDGAPQVSKIKALRTASGGPGSHEWKRQPHANGTGAIRVRTFHGRLSDEGMAFIDEKINEWLESHADIEVKFVTTNIGVFEGKIREPALIVNVWY